MKFINTQLNRRLTWDEFFMGVAILSSMRSKDPNTKVGACIVRDHKILSTGYNGMPRTCDDCGLPTGRNGNFLDTKYPYTVHAEMNAILNAPSTDLTDCTLYVTHFPCCECAKAILQTGISKIVYLENKHPEDGIYVAADMMFALSAIEAVKMELDNE